VVYQHWRIRLRTQKLFSIPLPFLNACISCRLHWPYWWQIHDPNRHDVITDILIYLARLATLFMYMHMWFCKICGKAMAHNLLLAPICLSAPVTRLLAALAIEFAERWNLRMVQSNTKSQLQPGCAYKSYCVVRQQKGEGGGSGIKTPQTCYCQCKYFRVR